jgi:hypothetical protein
MEIFLNTTDINNPTIEITHKFKVWFKSHMTKNTKPIIMEVPHRRVQDAKEFIWQQIGKRPSSMQKI